MSGGADPQPNHCCPMFPALPCNTLFRLAFQRDYGTNVSDWRGSIHDHGGVGRFGHSHAVYPCDGMEFPDIASAALLDDLDAQLIAGDHRTAELRSLDRHEIDELAGGRKSTRLN